jgi:hypothetical protein
MNQRGYDEQFGDRVFHTSIHNSARRRPGKWPKSVSEMRRYTSYDLHGGDSDPDRETAYSDFQTRRPYDTHGAGYGPGRAAYGYPAPYGAGGAVRPYYWKDYP